MGVVGALAAPARARRGQSGASRLFVVANRYTCDESRVAARGAAASRGGGSGEADEEEELAE
eukprot:5638989-Prymnesium_polylepis.1